MFSNVVNENAIENLSLEELKLLNRMFKKSQPKLYDYHVVDGLIIELSNMGYDCIQIDEGILGSGNWVCIPPVDGWYNYIITEIPTTCWSSGHKIRRCRKLNKELQKVLESLEY